MDRLKTFAKYGLWIVALYIFTMFCTFVGFNSTYRDIDNKENLQDGLTIRQAQATKVNGRIYGEITSNEENDLNDKYIKVQIYDKKGDNIGAKYIQIKDTQLNEPKKFAVYFTAENIKSYTVDILENTEEVQEKARNAGEIFKDIFTDKDLKKYAIITLLLYGIFI